MVSQPKRVCQIIKLKPEYVEEYKAIHAAVFPSVLATLARHHITDYSIHHYPPLQLLVATFKYTGENFEKDLAAIAADKETQRWWKLTDEMQVSFNEGATGSGGKVPWWTDLEEVFRFEGEPTSRSGFVTKITKYEMKEYATKAEEGTKA